MVEPPSFRPTSDTVCCFHWYQSLAAKLFPVYCKRDKRRCPFLTRKVRFFYSDFIHVANFTSVLTGLSFWHKDGADPCRVSTSYTVDKNAIAFCRELALYGAQSWFTALSFAKQLNVCQICKEQSLRVCKWHSEKRNDGSPVQRLAHCHRLFSTISINPFNPNPQIITLCHTGLTYRF